MKKKNKIRILSAAMVLLLPARRRGRRGAALILSLVLLLAGCGAENTEEKAQTETKSGETSAALQEEEALSFTGVDIEGNQVSSDIFSESKITMVNVWATYCNPCLSEMPGLGELAEAYEEGEFRVVGIISDVMEDADQETIEAAKDLIVQTEAGYTHLLLNESVYRALLTEVSVVPTTFFIDENGVVVDTVLGALEKSAWEEKINALLEKR